MKKEVLYDIDKQDNAEVNARLLELNHEWLDLEQKKLGLREKFKQNPSQQVIEQLRAVNNDIIDLKRRYKEYADRQSSLELQSYIMDVYEEQLSPDDFDPKKVN